MEVEEKKRKVFAILHVRHVFEKRRWPVTRKRTKENVENVENRLK